LFNAIEAELLERAISLEEEIPGWKIVEGRSNRKWPDDEISVYRRLKKLGLKDGAIYDQVIISPAQAEEKIKAKAGLKKEDAAKIINAIAVKPPGAKSLVRTSDKRPALASDADAFMDDDPFERR
jgi:predicted DNA-binding antitoxin AbrB/MazE fold protein